MDLSHQWLAFHRGLINVLLATGRPLRIVRIRRDAVEVASSFNASYHKRREGLLKMMRHPGFNASSPLGRGFVLREKLKGICVAVIAPYRTPCWCCTGAGGQGRTDATRELPRPSAQTEPHCPRRDRRKQSVVSGVVRDQHLQRKGGHTSRFIFLPYRCDRC